MECVTINWKINRHSTFTSFRSLLLIVILSAIISVYLLAFSEGQILYLRLTLIILAFAGIFFAIIKQYHQTRAEFITIKGDLMQIPRFGKKTEQLLLSMITSVEKQYFSKELIGALIGRKNCVPVIIERRIFHSKDDFYRCVKLLDNISSQNQVLASTKQGILTSAKQINQNAWVADTLAALLVFLYAIFSTYDFHEINHDIVFRIGLDKQLIELNEYYRFFTSFFFHYSPFHLLPNVISLSIVGRHIIKIFGVVRFSNILFLAVISGSLSSLLFSHHQIVLGSSGGIFGLIGAHLFACARFSNYLPNSTLVPLRTIIILLILQLLFDLIIEGSDIFSHLGGGTLGFLYAWAISKDNPISERPRISWLEIFLAIILVVFCATNIYAMSKIFFKNFSYFGI